MLRTLQVLVALMAASCATRISQREARILQEFDAAVRESGNGSFGGAFLVSDGRVSSSSDSSVDVVATGMSGLTLTFQNPTFEPIWNGVDFRGLNPSAWSADDSKQSLQASTGADGESTLGPASDAVWDVIHGMMFDEPNCTFLAERILVSTNDDGGFDLRLFGCRKAGPFVPHGFLTLRCDFDKARSGTHSRDVVR